MWTDRYDAYWHDYKQALITGPDSRLQLYKHFNTQNKQKTPDWSLTSQSIGSDSEPTQWIPLPTDEILLQELVPNLSVLQENFRPVHAFATVIYLKTSPDKIS